MAYVHGNEADAAALALTNALASPGPGLLMLPVRGAVMVHAQPFKRREDKDQLGYIAFECKFIRDGAPAAIVSLPSLLNVAFGAVDALQSASVAAFRGAVNVTNVPDFVARAAFNGLADGAAALDLVRSSNAVDVAVSASVRNALAGVVAQTDQDGDIGAIGADLFAAARALGDGMAPESAIAAMSDTIEAFAETF
jgi:hypothetical protein